MHRHAPLALTLRAIRVCRVQRVRAAGGLQLQLRHMLVDHHEALLGEIFGRGSYREREMTVECGDESALAPALRQVAAAHPEVYIKSRASHFGHDVTFSILISASATSAEEADAMIERASRDLTRAFHDAGIL